ncbi:MAG: hypothetical protein Q7J68_00415 [Thermoplasmata archaeon]|nr:hypothetical protein [Thermoplasmata archaeon]
MKLYKVPEKLAASGLAVFTTRDLARLLGISSGAASVYTHRLKEMEMIYPVEKGRFSITEDSFIVATQVSNPSYLSFSSAFYLHGRLDQVVDSLLVVAARKKRELNFMNTRINFIKFPPDKLFGYRKHKKGDSFVMLADLEKAAVDSLYRPRYASFSTVFEALSGGFDASLFEEYVIKMGSEAVIRRAGYLMEQLGEKTNLKPSTKVSYHLNPLSRRVEIYESRWKLYVNEVVG